MQRRIHKESVFFFPQKQPLRSYDSYHRSTAQFISLVKYFVKQFHIWFNEYISYIGVVLLFGKKTQDCDLHNGCGTLQTNNHTFRKDLLLSKLISSITCLQGSLRSSSADCTLTGKECRQRGLYSHPNNQRSLPPVHSQIWQSILVFVAHKLLGMGSLH